MILARLLSASPDSDGENWSLKFRGHSDVWHTDGFKLGLAPTPIKKFGRGYRPGVPYPWRPNNALNNGSIAELNGVYGFRLVANTANSPTTLDIYGLPPVNDAPIYSSAPQVPLQASVATTGGSIPTGTYLLAISADVAGPVSLVITAVMPASVTTGTITISGVAWPAGAAPAISVYAGTHSQNLRQLQPLTDWTGSANDSNGNPTTFTIQGIEPDGPGLPDPNFSSFRLRAKDIIHGGVWGDAPTSVGTSGGFGTATFAAAAWSTNQWAGYTLSSYQKGGGLSGNVPFDWVVASNTANTLTFTTAAHPPSGVVCVLRAAAASITSTTIGDANFVNSYAPMGLAVNAEVGNLVRIIAGTGANQAPIPIASNTATVLTLASKWRVTPDSTSLYIIEAASWRYSLDTSPILGNGTGTLNPLLGSIPVTNNFFGSLLVQAVTLDKDGNPSIVRFAPLREIYVAAQPLTARASDGEYAIPLTTVSRTLAAAITSTTATTCTLDASTGLPAAPFLMTLVSGECVRVTANSGASVTAMDRGWNGTVAATQANGSAVTIITATPDISQGRAQAITEGGNVTLLAPINAAGALSWTLDVIQDSVGGWSTYPSGTYVGIADDTAGDPRKWDNSPSMRYYVNFAIGADGNTRPAGGSGPYSLI